MSQQTLIDEDLYQAREIELLRRQHAYERQVHEKHRTKKFSARQKARTCPAAWMHNCARVVGAYLRRDQQRVDATVITDQLAAQGETITFVASDETDEVIDLRETAATGASVQTIMV